MLSWVGYCLVGIWDWGDVGVIFAHYGNISESLSSFFSAAASLSLYSNIVVHSGTVSLI